MDIQVEQSDQSAYRLAIVSLVLGIISIFGPAMFLSLIILEGIFHLDALDVASLLGPNGYDILDTLFGIGFFTGLLGLPSLIIGNIAFRRTSAKKERGRGIAIAGFILGILAILGTLFWFAVIILG